MFQLSSSYFSLAKKVVALATLCVLLSSVFSASVFAETPAASPEPTPAGDHVEMPVITDILIADNIERKGAKVTLRGKNLLPTKGSVSVSFPSDSGGSVSVSSFTLQSPTTLIFELPDKVGTGNVTVKVTGEKNTSLTSAPYQFAFHQPKILFVSGEDGIAPGKKITIWGEYLDGVYMQNNGRSRILPLKNATLQGGDAGKNGNLSVIEVQLPTGDFKKSFWVERGCDQNGENCLKSNSISFAQVMPPILTEIQVDYKARTATVFGKNFPTEEKDFSVQFAGSKMKVNAYDTNIGKATFSLPCPLPYRAEVNVTNQGETSNPLLFVAEDAPTIMSIAIKLGEQTGMRTIEVAANTNLDIKPTAACSDSDNTLSIGGTNFAVQPFGGTLVAKDVEFSKIPATGKASIVINGVRSTAIDFSKETFSPEPYIYSVESKYGLRQGAPFAVYGRNLGTEYKACSSGETSISGPPIYDEQKLEVFDGYDAEGEQKFTTICERIPPKVAPGQITGQFRPLSLGSAPQVGVQSLSVSVAGKSSNKISFTFGDTSQKVAYAPPEITAIEFPEGRNIGDSIIIRGSGFAASANQNLVKFGSVIVYPTSANLRGTELRAVIPEAAGSSVVVTRTIPEPKQDSEPFTIVISKSSESGLSFELVKDAKKSEEITLDDKKVAITVAEMKMVNTIADVQVNRFRLMMRFSDGDAEDEYSFKQLKILPFAAFTLKRNGAILAPATAARISGNLIAIEFDPFVLPLTTSESDTLTLSTELLRFVTDKASFAVTFDPQDAVSFQALDLDRKTGVYSKTKNALNFTEFSINKTPNDLCIDTESSNIHCDEYLQSLAKNSSFTAKKPTPTPTVPTFDRHRQNQIALITSNDKVAKLESKLTVARESKLKKMALRIAAEVVERVRQILQNRDEQILLNYAKSLQEASHDKIVSEEAKVEVAREQMREQIAEIKRNQRPLAVQLGSSRKDTDRDGLTDEEEALIGTDPKNPDTDGDSYNDFQEVEFGYSPLNKKNTLLFSDLADAKTATSAIARLFLFGVLDGYDDKTFRPDIAASRAQFVTTLSLAFFGLELTAPATGPAVDVSSDVWFAPQIAAAKDAGYLVDEIDVTNSFRPHAAITRIAACRVALKYTQANPDKFKSSDVSIADVIPQDVGWANECVERKLLFLTDQETAAFSPNTELTRAQMAVMIHRIVREKT